MIEVPGIDIQHFQDRYYKIFDNTIWMLLMRHNCTDGTHFTDNNEARYNVKNEKKYSILSTINNNMNFLRIEGKFEFLIEYPGFHEGINRWRQKNYILEQEDTEDFVTGYEKKQIDIIASDQGWKGLSLSTCEHALIHGTKFINNYNYAFGTTRLLEGFIPTSINQGTKESLLWMRIPSVTYLYLRKPQTCRLSMISPRLIFLSLFTGLFISI